MRNKRIIALAGTVALVGVVGVGATLAYFTDTDNTLNTVTMGHVDIDLDEPIFSAENENNTIENVTPNQTITKDPTITVKADSESCYLRAKVQINGLEPNWDAELLEGINIDDSLWVLSDDGYYYFQYAVGKAGVDQKFKLFDTVTIPEEWGNEMTDKTFTIGITAEAIQADNFTPEETNGVITGWVNSEGEDITAETYNG